MDNKLELSNLLQKALELEHAAYLQYLAHAEVVTGETSPGIIAQLKDNAEDEAKHADTLRNLIGNYLGYFPSMSVAKTHEATSVPQILTTNIKDENTTIVQYKKILQWLETNKDIENHNTFWEEIRLILIDEERHVVELEILQD